MNKHVFMSILLLGITLFLTGCGNSPVAQYPFQNQKAIESGQFPTTTSPLATGTCLTGCSALESGTGLINRETCEAGCWTEEAKAKKDITICNKIPATDSLMLLGCRMSVAEAAGDVKFCDTIGDSMADIMRGSCYATIAKQKKDISICESIKGTLMYQGCLDDVTGDKTDTPSE